jgi:hypothetical protein
LWCGEAAPQFFGSLLFKTGFERGFAMQTLSQSQKTKALLSKAFVFWLIKFASLTRTDVK